MVGVGVGGVWCGVRVWGVRVEYECGCGCEYRVWVSAGVVIHYRVIYPQTLTSTPTHTHTSTPYPTLTPHITHTHTVNTKVISKNI